MKQLIGHSKNLISQNISFFFVAWLILLSLDLASYFIQNSWGHDQELGRLIEIGYQLLLVYLSVCFFHALGLLNRGEGIRTGTLLGEGLLLTPGFVLHSILFGLIFLLGVVLLVLPGLYAFVMYYFNPLLAVIYPDYKGKIFSLGPQLIRPHWQQAVGVILFSGLLPFIPEGAVYFSTGALKSWLTPILAPLDGALYIFCETVAFEFVYRLVQGHRNQSIDP